MDISLKLGQTALVCANCGRFLWQPGDPDIDSGDFFTGQQPPIGLAEAHRCMYPGSEVHILLGARIGKHMGAINFALTHNGERVTEVDLEGTLTQ